MNPVFKTPEYQLIKEHYGDNTAKRSGVPLINHIHEGLMILDFLFVQDYECTKQAYCLHPIFQSDKDLQSAFKQLSKINHLFNKKSLLLTMEYRNIANQYLSHHQINSIDDIQLSPLMAVDDMLIADKVQNRKDFELYHEGTHPRSAELKAYFKNWLERLEISEAQYQYFKTKLIEMKQWQLLPNLSNGNGLDPELIVYTFEDTTTKGRFKFELVSEEPFQLLHTHILEYKEGGYKINSKHPNTSGYWKAETFTIGTYVNGERHRGNLASWQIDLSTWVTN